MVFTLESLFKSRTRGVEPALGVLGLGLRLGSALDPMLLLLDEVELVEVVVEVPVEDPVAV